MEKKWSVSEIIHYRRVGVINRRIGGSKSCLTAHSPSASRDRMERFHAGEELPADPGFTEHRTGRGADRLETIPGYFYRGQGCEKVYSVAEKTVNSREPAHFHVKPTKYEQSVNRLEIEWRIPSFSHLTGVERADLVRRARRR